MDLTKNMKNDKNNLLDNTSRLFQILILVSVIAKIQIRLLAKFESTIAKLQLREDGKFQ